MKQRFTTPVSNIKHSAKKITLITAAVVLALTTSLQVVTSVGANDYDRRIAEVQAQIEAYQTEAGKLAGQADSLQKELSALSAERGVIQGQINLKQAEHDKLAAEITTNEKKIQDNKDALGKTIADLYVASNISPLEMLASSNTISDYVDKESYQNSVRDSLTRTIDSIRTLKKQLEVQKKDVERVLAEQKLARDELVTKERQQANLVAQTRGQEAAYARLAGERQSQKLELQRAQQAAIQAAERRAGGKVSVLPGDPNKGGYPWEANCWVDANAYSHGGANGIGGDPLGYGCRQCVSYTAAKVGIYLSGDAYKGPRSWGNANMWPASARSVGYTTSSAPRVNSVGVISSGDYGHVVWVEAVNGDGTVDVSQYNYFNAGGSGWGHYSKMRVSAATYDTYIYF